MTMRCSTDRKEIWTGDVAWPCRDFTLRILVRNNWHAELREHSLGRRNWLARAACSEPSRLTTFRKATLISGVLWAVWHFPILISGPLDLQALYGVLCFTIMVVGMSFAMCWLRLRSGSLWTEVFFHASHNLFVQRVLTPLTVDKGKTEWFVDETCAGLALAGIVMAAIFWNSDPQRLCHREASLA
jgi:hypothetical protein